MICNINHRATTLALFGIFLVTVSPVNAAFKRAPICSAAGTTSAASCFATEEPEPGASRDVDVLAIEGGKVSDLQTTIDGLVKENTWLKEENAKLSAENAELLAAAGGQTNGTTRKKSHTGTKDFIHKNEDEPSFSPSMTFSNASTVLSTLSNATMKLGKILPYLDEHDYNRTKIATEAIQRTEEKYEQLQMEVQSKEWEVKEAQHQNRMLTDAVGNFDHIVDRLHEQLKNEKLLAQKATVRTITRVVEKCSQCEQKNNEIAKITRELKSRADQHDQAIRGTNNFKNKLKEKLLSVAEDLGKDLTTLWNVRK